MKRFIWIAVVCALALGCVAMVGCSAGDGSTAQSGTISKSDMIAQAQDTDLLAIGKEIKSNPIRAKSEWDGKVIKATAIVESIYPEYITADEVDWSSLDQEDIDSYNNFQYSIQYNLSLDIYFVDNADLLAVNKKTSLDFVGKLVFDDTGESPIVENAYLVD